MKIRHHFLMGVLSCILALGPALSSSYAEPTWRARDKYVEVMTQLRQGLGPKPAFDNGEPRSKIRAFFYKTPQQKLEAQINAAYDSIAENRSGSPRENYRKFLKAIREGDKIIENDKKGNIRPAPKRIFEKLTRVVYTGVDIHQFNDRLVCGVAEEALKRGSKLPQREPSKTNFRLDNPLSNSLKSAQKNVDLLSSIFDRIRANPQINFFQKLHQSFRGEFTFADLDPNMQANLISVKNTFIRADGSKMLALRMPTQTIGSSKSTRISPEFKVYLNSLQKDEEGPKKHTYINLQDIRESARGQKWAPTIFSDERNRGRALHNFGDSQKNLILISLNKNSPFYRQSGKSAVSKMNYDESQSFSDFKKEVLRHFVPDDDEEWKKTGIRLGALWDPDKWDTKDFPLSKPLIKKLSPIKNMLHRPFIIRTYKAEVRKQIEDRLDSLGQSLGWADAKSIPPNARQAFIELSYDLVSDYATRDSYSSNKTCKDAIDRGGGANALAYFSTLLRQRCSPNKAERIDEATFNQKMEELPGVLFSDALQTRKRAIIEERLHYFQNAANVLIGGLERKGCDFFNAGCNQADKSKTCLREQFSNAKLDLTPKKIASKPQDALLKKDCRNSDDTSVSCTQEIPFENIVGLSKPLEDAVQPTRENEEEPDSEISEK